MQNASKADTGFNWLALTSVITLSVPILYIVGRAYIGGYFTVYGVSTDFFTYTTQDYLYYALMGVFQTLFIAFKSLSSEWKVLVVLIFILAIGLFAYTEINNSAQPKKSEWFEKRPFVKKIFLSVITGTLVMAIIYFILTSLLFLMLIPISIGHLSGKYVAANEIRDDHNACSATSHKTDNSACIGVFDGEKMIASGRVIAVSAEYVAIANNGETSLIPVNGLTFKIKKAIFKK